MNVHGFRPHILLVAFLLFSSSRVFSYEFEFLGMGSPVHDQLTEKALRCIMENENDVFTNCESFRPTNNKRALKVDVYGMKELAVDDLVLAARWSDDPVRELRGYKLLKVPLWGAQMRYVKCKGSREGLKDGLRCSSHYGPAQFLHSMEGQLNKSPEVTRNAILDWVEFSYQVAVNAKVAGKHFVEEEYCSYFSGLDDDKYFKRIMYPGDGNDFPCNQDDETPWRVSTPFSFSCSVGVYNCTEWNGVNDMRVRRAALGAILHAIQDSFSQGHASRVGENTDSVNKYSCAPIKQFQVYGEQDSEKHTDSDVKASPSDNCLSPSLNQGGVHGPITASAHVIRLFKNKSPAKDVRDYLARHVFVVNDGALLAGSTEYFRKNM